MQLPKQAAKLIKNVGWQNTNGQVQEEEESFLVVPFSALFPYTSWKMLGNGRPFLRSILVHQLNNYFILLITKEVTETV